MTEFIARLALAMTATAVVVAFFLHGVPLGAVVAVVVAVMIRRRVETSVLMHRQTHYEH